MAKALTHHLGVDVLSKEEGRLRVSQRVQRQGPHAFHGTDEPRESLCDLLGIARPAIRPRQREAMILVGRAEEEPLLCLLGLVATQNLDSAQRQRDDASPFCVFGALNPTPPAFVC